MLSPGSSAQLRWHAEACSLMRAASLAPALGRGWVEGQEEEEGEEVGGGQLLLSRSAAVAAAAPSGLAAAAIAAAAEVEDEAAAEAKANADASSFSSACFTELKRPLALRDAGARVDIWETEREKIEQWRRMKMFFFFLF